MKQGPFLPDAFAIALALLGGILLVFPSLRVAGALAVLLALLYWLLMATLKIVRR